MNDEDRRRHPRFPVPRIPGVLAFSVGAEVVDVSVAGMQVECPVPLAVGKRFAVRIGTGAEQLDLVGSVRWCERIAETGEDDFRGRYRAGFAFHDILTERAQSLVDFMERNVVVALDKQLFGRLELDGKTRAELQGDLNFRIERLGLETAELEIDAPQPPEEGAVYELEANLQGIRFATLARIVEVRALELERGGYRVEIEFVETPPEQLETLRSFVRERLE